MPKITKKGKELTTILWGSIPVENRKVRAIEEVCSLICRHATTHQRLMEDACNLEIDTRKVGNIEGRIVQLVKWHLKELTGLDIRIKFSCDPRGYTVKLVMPDGHGGEEGLGVPQ